MASTVSTASGFLRSRTTDFLPRFNRSRCSCPARKTPPPGLSTRTTWAPRSASVIPANGPGPIPPSSNTFTPDSGPLLIVTPVTPDETIEGNVIQRLRRPRLHRGRQGGTFCRGVNGLDQQFATTPARRGHDGLRLHRLEDPGVDVHVSPPGHASQPRRGESDLMGCSPGRIYAMTATTRQSSTSRGSPSSATALTSERRWTSPPPPGNSCRRSTVTSLE